MPNLEQPGRPAQVTGNSATFTFDHEAGKDTRYSADGSDFASLTAVVIGPNGEAFTRGTSGTIPADAPVGTYTIVVDGGEGYEPGGMIQGLYYRSDPRVRRPPEPERRYGRRRGR